jgi:hypothetical protein
LQALCQAIRCFLKQLDKSDITERRESLAWKTGRCKEFRQVIGIYTLVQSIGTSTDADGGLAKRSGILWKIKIFELNQLDECPAAAVTGNFRSVR